MEVFCERMTDQELDEHNRRVADLVKKSREQAQARAAMTIDDHIAAIKDPQEILFGEILFSVEAENARRPTTRSAKRCWRP